MLVIEGEGGAWAWSGVRLSPAVGVDATRAYSDVPEERRWEEAARAERAWLATQVKTVFAVRYVNAGRGDGLLDSYLLWRAQGQDGVSASAAASEAGARLTQVPRHLATSAFMNPDDVSAALNPFAPHASGLAELRKRMTASRSSRADTGRGVCLAIEPFGTQVRSWEPLWAMLAELEFSAMLTVTLSPFPVDARLSAGFQRLAEEYAYLSAPGRSATAIYDRPSGPDAFAARAAPLYADAARRYVGSVFTACVTLASERQLPPLLGETLAGIVADSAQSPPVVIRPAAGEMSTMWGNISRLNLDVLETAALQAIPSGAVGPLERLLGGVVDLTEASALFRMPYSIPGHLKLFRDFEAPDAGPAPSAPSPPGRDPWLSRFTSGGSR